MSNYWESEEGDNSDLVKRLRQEIKDRDKVLSEKDATIAEREKELSTLRPQVRLTTVKDVLNDLGVNVKVAKLVPSDVDPTKDAVSAWLTEFGDVLGVKPADTAEAPAAPETKPEAPAPEVTPETADQWMRVQSQEAAAGATTPDKEAKDLAQLTAAYKAALTGGGSEAFFEMLQGERPIP